MHSYKRKKANFVLYHRRAKHLGCILYQASVYMEMGNRTVKCQAKSGKGHGASDFQFAHVENY